MKYNVKKFFKELFNSDSNFFIPPKKGQILGMITDCFDRIMTYKFSNVVDEGNPIDSYFMKNYGTGLGLILSATIQIPLQLLIIYGAYKVSKKFNNKITYYHALLMLTSLHIYGGLSWLLKT